MLLCRLFQRFALLRGLPVQFRFECLRLRIRLLSGRAQLLLRLL